MAKTLQNMIEEGQASQATDPASIPAVPAPVIPVAEVPVPAAIPEVAAVPSEPLAVETETSEVKPAADEAKDAKSWLRDFLEKHNKHTEGIPDSELEAYAARKLFETPAPVAAVVQQPAFVSTQVAPVAEVQTPSDDKKSRKVAKLQYDQALATMVSFDDDGRAVPRPEFGGSAIEAASKVNQYSEARRKRVEDLVDDPIGFLQDDMLDIVREEMRGLIGKEFENFKSSQQTEYQRFSAERAQDAERSSVTELLTLNKSKLYIVGKDGQPALSLDTNLPILSPYGSAVDEELKELEQINPNAQQSLLIAKAIRTVDKIFSQPEKLTPETVAAKKQAFLEKDKRHVVPVSPDRPEASLADALANHAPMTLLEMIKRNPNLVGNPALAEL